MIGGDWELCLLDERQWTGLEVDVLWVGVEFREDFEAFVKGDKKLLGLVGVSGDFLNWADDFFDVVALGEGGGVED